MKAYLWTGMVGSIFLALILLGRSLLTVDPHAGGASSLIMACSASRSAVLMATGKIPNEYVGCLQAFTFWRCYSLLSKQKRIDFFMWSADVHITCRERLPSSMLNDPLRVRSVAPAELQQILGYKLEEIGFTSDAEYWNAVNEFNLWLATPLQHPKTWK